MRSSVAILAASALALAAAPAGAASLSVESRNARAVIQTQPFGLSFQNADSGQTVLQEVPGDGLPKPGAQLFPALFSVRTPTDGAPVYEPLGYQVGGQGSVQAI